ncbi:MAG: hypothetical protein ACRC03_05570 [Romboutsia sp.]
MLVFKNRKSKNYILFFVMLFMLFIDLKIFSLVTVSKQYKYIFALPTFIYICIFTLTFINQFLFQEILEIDYEGIKIITKNIVRTKEKKLLFKDIKDIKEIRKKTFETHQIFNILHPSEERLEIVYKNKTIKFGLLNEDELKKILNFIKDKL